MNKRMIVSFLCIISWIATLKAQLPNTFLVKPAHLTKLKESYLKGDAKSVELIKVLMKNADKELKEKTLSVTTKIKIPTGGTKHDYLSMAPYYWPDSTKPNLLPYINKDGLFNPEIYTITDHQNIQRLERWVQDLSLAFYFTGDEKYALKATQFLQVWFIDTATYMNPNLNYAQAIMGQNTGRASGMIDACELPTIVNAISLLSGSKSWTKEHDTQMKDWFQQYYSWLLESKNGLTEKKNKNNHGTWYDQQIVAVGLYLDKKEWAKTYLSECLNRITVQIEPDGHQPLEVTRTNALHYSTFAIEAWFRLATLADNLNVDIWNYSTAEGRSIKKAFDWLLPFAMGEKKWEYKQTGEYKRSTLYKLLLQASNHYEGNYYQLANKIKVEGNNYIADIFYNRLDQ